MDTKNSQDQTRLQKYRNHFNFDSKFFKKNETRLDGANLARIKFFV